MTEEFMVREQGVLVFILSGSPSCPALIMISRNVPFSSPSLVCRPWGLRIV